MKTPKIRPPKEDDDFHDSSLLDFIVNPTLSKITVVVSTPDRSGREHLWQIQFKGVLRVEFETTGDGKEEKISPVEIYSIYEDRESGEYKRWNKRAKQLGIDGELHHIVLASSFMRGCGEREDLEGIAIICKEWKVEHAPSKYNGI